MKNELDKLKRSMKTQALLFIALAILSVFACLICYNLGYNKHQREIMQRGKELLNSDKELYNSQDVEILIFGDTQN